MHGTGRMALLLVAVIFMIAIVAIGCAPDGASLFKKECASCHAFKGFGGSICPDLTEIAKRRDDNWMRRQLRDPSANDPNSKMPSFERLSDKEVQALIDHFKS